MDFLGTVRGEKELDKVLAKLPKVSRKYYMQALRAGGSVVRNAAERNLLAVADKGYSTGAAEKNIRVYNYRKYKGNYRVGVQIKRKAVNRKKIIRGEPVRIGLYASVLEYGKKNQAPRSWIRKAAREEKDKAYDEIRKTFALNLDKAINEAKR